MTLHFFTNKTLAMTELKGTIEDQLKAEMTKPKLENAEKEKKEQLNMKKQMQQNTKLDNIGKN